MPFFIKSIFLIQNNIQMYILVGGEERYIGQVESFSELNDISGMTAGEIFYGARAGKLFDKVLQIEVDRKARRVAEGQPVEFPALDKYVIDPKLSPLENAKNMEYFYAEMANRILH
jgi:hypothetical protein